MTGRRAIMTDIFQKRYFKINKLYLSSIGQWPDQSQWQRCSALAVILFFAALQLPPQIIAITKLHNNPEIIAESTLPLVTFFIFLTEFVNMFLNSDKLLQLFRRIEMDWISMAHEPEINVLHNYAEKGRQFTIAYSVALWVITVVCDCQPYVPRIMELIKLNNETLPKVLVFPADYYGLDLNTYYYYFLIHEYISAMTATAIIITVDTTFMIQIQHACGMFAVVGHQLKRMSNDINEEFPNYSQCNLDPAFGHLAACIKKHSNIIEFSEILEAYYTWAFLMNVGLHLLATSYVGIQIVFMVNMKSKQTIRYVVFILAVIFHLWFLSIFAQRLMDHSQQIGEYLCHTEWYKTSLATQKLLNLMIMRSRKPCRLTAGKIMTMSMEKFAAVIRTSMSYFTVMRSMQ